MAMVRQSNDFSSNVLVLIHRQGLSTANVRQRYLPLLGYIGAYPP